MPPSVLTKRQGQSEVVNGFCLKACVRNKGNFILIRISQTKTNRLKCGEVQIFGKHSNRSKLHSRKTQDYVRGMLAFVLYGCETRSLTKGKNID
jgi:hypothetical protein